MIHNLNYQKLFTEISKLFNESFYNFTDELREKLGFYQEGPMGYNNDEFHRFENEETGCIQKMSLLRRLNEYPQIIRIHLKINGTATVECLRDGELLFKEENVTPNDILSERKGIISELKSFWEYESKWHKEEKVA